MRTLDDCLEMLGAMWDMAPAEVLADFDGDTDKVFLECWVADRENDCGDGGDW